MRLLLAFFVGLVCSYANAGIVVSLSVNGFVETNTTVDYTIEVLGAANTGTQLVSNYGLDVTVAGQTNPLSMRSTTGPGSPWNGVILNTMTFPGSIATFTGGPDPGSPVSIVPNPAFAVTTTPTRIGQMLFRITKINVPETVTLTAGPALAPLDPPSIGEGFWLDERIPPLNPGDPPTGAYSQIATDYGDPLVLNIGAIPEPTSLMLCGFGLVPLLLRRRE